MAALARRGPIDWANSAAVVPSASSRFEPSGSRTEMTPAIVQPFLVSRAIWSHRIVLNSRVLEEPELTDPAKAGGPAASVRTVERGAAPTRGRRGAADD